MKLGGSHEGEAGGQGKAGGQGRSMERKIRGWLLDWQEAQEGTGSILEGSGSPILSASEGVAGTGPRPPAFWDMDREGCEVWGGGPVIFPLQGLAADVELAAPSFLSS